jgi:lipoyl(octanoyl) transferase
MVYPVMKLAKNVVAYLETLASALADLAATLGVPNAAWRRDPAGLWLGGAKLAACGLHLRRGVAIHGFAFNVATPADAWNVILPCGLTGARVTSIADERAQRGLPPPPLMEDIAGLAGPLLVARLV